MSWVYPITWARWMMMVMSQALFKNDMMIYNCLLTVTGNFGQTLHMSTSCVYRASRHETQVSIPSRPSYRQALSCDFSSPNQYDLVISI